MSKQTTTDFREKIQQALVDNPNEAIQALHNGGYPLSKYQKVLSAVSELVEECKPEKLEQNKKMYPEDFEPPWDVWNQAIDEYEKNLKEALK